MTEFGIVTQSGNGRSTLAFARPEACEKCGACGGVKHKHTLEIAGEYPVGHWLRVEMPEGRFLQASALAYALPLAALMIGLLAGYFALGRSEAGGIAGALLGLALALGALWLQGRRIARDGDWQPAVTGEYADKPTQADIGCGAGQENL